MGITWLFQTSPETADNAYSDFDAVAVLFPFLINCRFCKHCLFGPFESSSVIQACSTVTRCEMPHKCSHYKNNNERQKEIKKKHAILLDTMTHCIILGICKTIRRK